MIGVDTNILVYAESVGDPRRNALADRVLSSISASDLVLPVQVLGELFRVLSLKTKLTPGEVRARLARWQEFATLAPTMESTIATAFDLSTEHRLQIFDAIILAASAEAGCRMLLSEDMGDGFVWRGVTVVNPFAATPHPLLSDAMRS